MATSGSGAGLRDRVCCGVCMEQYNNNIHVPKLLPCQHTFCQGCLISWSNASLSSSIECPVCRSHHNVPATGFTTNLAILDIVEELQKESTPDVLRCKVHGNMESFFVCVDCITGLCVKCIKETRRNPQEDLHKDHQLEEVNDAKALLQQKFEPQIKEKRSVLQQKVSKIDTLEISKTETDIRIMYNELDSILTAWRDAQLAEMAGLRDEAIRRKQELLEQDAKLVSLLQPNIAMETLVTKLTEQDFKKDNLQEDRKPPNQKFKFSERCEKLLESIIVVISSRNFVTSELLKEQKVTGVQSKGAANVKAKSPQGSGAACSALEDKQVSYSCFSFPSENLIYYFFYQKYFSTDVDFGPIHS